MSMTQIHPQYRLSLATCEPYFSYVHGESDNGKLIVIYEYTLDEFYDNQWKDELSFYKKNMLNKVKYQQHPMIRNYRNILKKFKLELVEIIEENNVCYSILHTYKLNILKRLWKKYKNHLN
jgi:hypothetical protein